MKSTKVLFLVVLFTNIMFAQEKETIWLKEAPIRMNWNDAMQYCKNANAILPAKKVFEKVWIANNKASDVAGFDLSVSFWTSDEVSNNKYAAYPFYFGKGKDSWYYKADHYGVRCIRK